MIYFVIIIIYSVINYGFAYKLILLLLFVLVCCCLSFLRVIRTTGYFKLIEPAVLNRLYRRSVA